MKILKRLPKSCWVGRRFGNDETEARRQLPIWKKNVGHSIGADCTVHLLHTAPRSWSIIVCGPDYKPR